MRRKINFSLIIPAMLFLGFGALMQKDGKPFHSGRLAHENYLNSLYQNSIMTLNGSSLDQERPDADKPVPDADKPVPDADKPVPDADKPVPDADKPVPDADKPVPGSKDPALRESDGGHSRGTETVAEMAGAPEYAGFRDYIMTMNPESRQVPHKAWLKAVRRVEEMRKSPLNTGGNTALKSGELFTWEEIPSNTGGRTRAIMYDPNDPNHEKVWAGGVTGGLWYIDNIRGSGYWKPVNDFWPSLAISCMAYNPLDPGTFYVGTGEGQTAVIIYRESSGRGSGIWKSGDAGESWFLLPSTGDFEYVTDIAIRVESGTSVIYAGVTSGIYKGETHSSRPEDGLYRSDDGGGTWTQVLPDIPGTQVPYSPADIEINAGGRIFVGTMRNVYQEGGGRILYSDDGLDWTVMDLAVPLIEERSTWNIPGRVILASAPSDQGRIYAIISGGQESADGFIRSQGAMIIRSVNGGKDWSEVNMPPRSPFSGSQWAFLAWHALTAAVKPDNPNILWVGGLDLYRSLDGGLSYEQKSLWWNFGRYYNEDYPVYVHADQHRVLYNPGRDAEILNANDGGVFLATDANNPWPQFREKNKGYNTLQYYTCAIHPDAGRRYFLGGCQDNGTFRTTYSPTSKLVSVSYGDGAYCFIDEDEPEIQISCSQSNFYYYSRDGSHRNIYAYDFPGGTFINPVDYDPIDNILYANGMDFTGNYRDSIFRIYQVNDTLLEATAVPVNTGSQVPFSAMHVLPYKENGNTVVFAGSASGRLYRLDNAQSAVSSTEIGSPDFPPGYISCVQTGNSADRILVSFSSYGVEHVWETTDGGDTWKDKTGNLPDMPVRWAIYVPGTDNMVMLATELGIWYTIDVAADPVIWMQAGDDFPNVRVDMLRSRKSDGYILAATHGRGLFLSPGIMDVSNRSPASPDGVISVFPNPAGDYINVEIRSDLIGEWVLGIYNSAGQLIRERSLGRQKVESIHYLSLEGLLPGTYIIRAECGTFNISETIIKRE
jgi:photosystem II stability/assembly factor-like uncharacterized protein